MNSLWLRRLLKIEVNYVNNKNKHIHFVGVKGVGMAPLAIIAKEAGFIVSGCDIDEQFITDEPLEKAGIKPIVGFNEEHVLDSDLVITTGAHGGFKNPEVLKAKSLGILVWTQGQAVGEFMKGGIFEKIFEGVSVAGSHGKTTTTAIIATILKENRMDPSFLIGTGSISSLGSCGHFGKGSVFVVEADEYATEPQFDKTPKFLWQRPKIGVITNIEFDHPDLYNSMIDLRKAFLDFANCIQKDGSLVACADDPETRLVLKEYGDRVITYGFSKSADYYIDKISIEPEKVFFWVNTKDASLGEFSLNVTGEHNALNALASIIVCLELGLSIENIKKGLLAFRGTKRRLEFVGNIPSGAMLYDDYAHHPTEIRKTLAAFKSSYPNKKIVCIFQPHTYSRTKSLFEQFVSSFNDADVVVIMDIFASSRENIDSSVSSKMLVEEISKMHKRALYLPNASDVVKYIGQENFGKDYILISMGAGNVYKIAKELIV
jgi:UDP-N-acetylmuramate--alanine ligase